MGGERIRLWERSELRRGHKERVGPGEVASAENVRKSRHVVGTAHTVGNAGGRKNAPVRWQEGRCQRIQKVGSMQKARKARQRERLQAGREDTIALDTIREFGNIVAFKEADRALQQGSVTDALKLRGVGRPRGRMNRHDLRQVHANRLEG